MYIIIVGAGKFGYNLTKLLISEGHEVMLIEKDKSKTQNLMSELGESVMYGDGASLEVLKEAGVNRADVLVSVTGEDEDNLVICQMAKIVFITPKTIARVNNPKNEEIFSSLGIDATVSATRLINALIEEQVKADSVVPLLTIHGGDLEIVEVELSSASSLINKKVRDIKLTEGAIFIALIRNDEIIVPRGDTEFMEEDKVIALVKKDKEQELRYLL